MPLCAPHVQQVECISIRLSSLFVFRCRRGRGSCVYWKRSIYITRRRIPLNLCPSSSILRSLNNTTQYSAFLFIGVLHSSKKTDKEGMKPLLDQRTEQNVFVLSFPSEEWKNDCNMSWEIFFYRSLCSSHFYSLTREKLLNSYLVICLHFYVRLFVFLFLPLSVTLATYKCAVYIYTFA